MSLIESGSSIASFMGCPREYYYKYVLLLEGRGYSSPLGLGSMVHAYIEQYSGKGRPDAALKELEQITSRIDPEQLHNLALDNSKAMGMFRAWKDYWENPVNTFNNGDWEWISSEQEFSFLVDSTGSRHVGKMDGLLRNVKWDKVFVYELKTAADRDRDSYVHRLQVDRQVSSNIMAAQHMNHQIDGVLYDIIWKPGIRQKVKETEAEFQERFLQTIRDAPNEYFQREIVYRNQEGLMEHHKDLNGQFAAIAAAEISGNYYRNSGHCDKYGKLCQFFPICMEGGAELESLYRKKDRKLPELSLEIQSKEKNEDPKDNGTKESLFENTELWEPREW